MSRTHLHLGEFVLLTLALSAAHAGFGSAILVSGTPEFDDCLSGGGCADNFYRFLTESMLEQGFAMQHPGYALSSLSGRSGTVAGATVTTFPFGDPQTNLSGKEENTDFSPAFPSLFAGHIGEEWTFGGAFLPPVPVGGASALQLAGVASRSFDSPVGERRAAEAVLTFVKVRAPITASEEQYAARENFSNPDNLDEEIYAEVCEVSEDGCIDTYIVANLELRAGQAWELRRGLSFYARAGLTVVDEFLHVQYDDTTWWLFTLQPTLYGGLGWEPGEHAYLSLGGALAPKQPNQNQSERPGVFYRFEGSAAWAF